MWVSRHQWTPVEGNMRHVLAYPWNHFCTALALEIVASSLADFFGGGFGFGFVARMGISSQSDPDSVVIREDATAPRFRLPMVRVSTKEVSAVAIAVEFLVEDLVERTVEVIEPPIVAVVVAFTFFLGGILQKQRRMKLRQAKIVGGWSRIKSRSSDDKIIDRFGRSEAVSQ